MINVHKKGWKLGQIELTIGSDKFAVGFFIADYF